MVYCVGLLLLAGFPLHSDLSYGDRDHCQTGGEMALRDGVKKMLNKYPLTLLLTGEVNSDSN